MRDARPKVSGRIDSVASRSTKRQAYAKHQGSDEQLVNEIAAVWRARGDRYSEIRTAETAAARKIEMSYIGG